MTQPTTPKTRNTVFVTVAISDRARTHLRSATVWASSLIGAKISAGDALTAMLAVAERYPDEVKAELAKTP